MKVSRKTFIMKTCQLLSSLTHAYRDTILGCMQTVRIYYGYECDATNEEMYDEVVETMKIICNMEGR